MSSSSCAPTSESRTHRQPPAEQRCGPSQCEATCVLRNLLFQRAYVRACVRACVRGFVCVCVCVCVCLSVCREAVKKRSTSLKVRAMGIFPGAKVQRGKHWSWADQDGQSLAFSVINTPCHLHDLTSLSLNTQCTCRTHDLISFSHQHSVSLVARTIDLPPSEH